MMSYRKRFIEWCQQPSRIKIHTVNPRNVVVLSIAFILVLASSFVGYQAVSSPPPFTPLPSGSISTLTITTDTTLTEDYFNTTIVIGADDITLDGHGHWIIGPSPDYIYYPDTEDVMPNATIGILLKGRTGVTIKNCRVTSFTFGYYLDSSDGNILQENVATNNGDGFFLGESEWNTLQGNMANDNVFIGFVLESSSDNIFRDNTAIGSGDDPPNGFELGRSFRNTFQGNTVNANLNGFALDEADGNIFRGNMVINNTLSGFMVGNSSDNLLTGNTVSNNTIEIWWGSNNRIYHNNFVDNHQQFTIKYSVNTWDDGYPSGGNYWSDYIGVDANCDGIGDTPYVIDENNIDQFPLMTPITVHT
jgi:parallel beta-helix repeat protein